MGNGLVYQPPDCSYYTGEYAGELLWVPRDEEKRLQRGIPCLLLQKPRASWLMLYFHANAEDLGQIYLLLRYFRTFLGVHVLAVEYPGYGLCSGEPSERQVLDDAETVLEFAVQTLDVPLDRILVVGRSLGGVPAIHLAANAELGGLVTLSTFSSAASFVAAGDVGRSLLGMVIGYDNVTRIRAVSCPTLIVHGEEDTAIDPQHAYELFEECGADFDGDGDVEKELVTRPYMGHNNFDNKEDLIRPIQEAFPWLNEGEPLVLSGVEELLQLTPKKLASDVIERLPYAPELMEKRHMLPFVKTKVISKDGEEI